MEAISQNTFWSAVTLIATVVGGAFIFISSHTSEPKHAEAAHISQVSALEVKTERVATNVANNARTLDEVKVDIKELRLEQRAASVEILEAIRNGGDR